MYEGRHSGYDGDQLPYALRGLADLVTIVSWYTGRHRMEAQPA